MAAEGTSWDRLSGPSILRMASPRGRGGGVHHANQRYNHAPKSQGQPYQSEMFEDNSYFTLYVKSIPPNWNETLLTRVFSRAAPPAEVFLKRQQNFPLNWGLVHYNTMEEALKAVNLIGSDIRYGLEVEFARRTYMPNDNNFDDDFLLNSYQDSKDSTKAITMSRTVQNTSRSNYMQTYTHIDNYTLDQIPRDREARIEDAIFKLVVKKREESKQYEGMCAVCDSPTSFGCFDCKQVNYCSPKCQQHDWPNHFKYCIKSPRISNDGSKADLQAGGDFNNSPNNKSKSQGHDRLTREDKPQQFERRNDNRQSRFDNAENNRGRFDQRDNIGGRTNQDNRERNLGSRNSEETPRHSGGRFNDRSQRNTGGRVNDEPPRNMFDERRSKLMKNRQDGQNGSDHDGKINGRPQRNGFDSSRNRDSFKPNRDNTQEQAINTSQEVNIDVLRKPSQIVKPPQETQQDIPPEHVMVVYIVPENTDFVWVLDLKNSEGYREMSVKIAALEMPLPSITPVESGICAAEYEGTICRCQITNLNPLTVTYIDYGNSETITPDRLFALPDTLASIPPYAIKIKLPHGIKKEYAEKFKIKRLSKQNDYWVCRIIEGAEDISSPVAPTRVPDPAPVSVHVQEPAPQPKQAINTSQEVNIDVLRKPSQIVKPPQETQQDIPPERVMVVYIVPENTDFVWVLDLKNSEGYREMSVKIAALEMPLPSITPVESGICAAEYEGTICRCQITNLNPLTVTYIDYGNSETITPDRLFALPDTIASIPPYAIKIKLPSGIKKEYAEKFWIKRLNKQNDYWVCRIIEGAEDITPPVAPTRVPDPAPVSVHVQEPAPQPKVIEQPTPKKPAFNNLLPADKFTKVNVIYRNVHTLSVTPLEKVKELQNLAEEVQKEAANASPIQVQPGVKCLARWSKDGKWYRGRIMSVEPLSVLLVDVGTSINSCSPGDLRALNPPLTKIPLLVCNVKPKNGSTTALKNKFSVKPLYKEENAWIVEVEDIAEEINQPMSFDSVVRSPHQTDVFPVIFNPHRFTTVIVTNQNSEGGWDYCVGNIVFWSTFLEMAQQFGQFATTCSLLNPTVGAVGLYFSEGAWNRVKVVSVSPLQVTYLEFGNVETIAAENLKQCPDTHKTVPALGYKIKLADGTDNKYLCLPTESELSLKPVAMLPDGTTVVHVEGVDYHAPIATSTPTSVHIVRDKMPESTQQPPQNQSDGIDQGVVSLLQAGWKVHFIPSSLDNKGFLLIGLLYTSHIPSTQIVINDELNSLIEGLPFIPNYKPKEGDIVGVNEETDWVRAQVLSEEFVLLTDFGKIKKLSKFKKLPPKACNIPTLAAFIVPLNLDLLEEMRLEEELVLTVERVHEGGAHVQWRGQPVGEMRDWRYNPLAVPQPLADGDLVTVNEIIDAASLFVAPDQLEMLQVVQIKCTEMAGKGITLKDSPKVGDFVAYKSEDVFFRSCVEQIDEAKKEYFLFQIDMGNYVKADISSLYPLPSSLLNLPCLATRVVLKGVENKPQTEKSLQYVHELIEKEEKLNIEFNLEVPGEVVLSRQNGEIVNKKVQDLLNTEVKPDSKGKLTLDSMHKFIPPMGVETKFLVTQTDPLYMAELAVFLKYNAEGSTNSKIQLHCKNPEVLPYNPCQGELCLAKFEGEWYRAQCLKETPSGISTIRLIDYGNLADVPFGDIRQIQSEFLDYPPLALPFKIKGLPKDLSPELKSVLDDKMTCFAALPGTVTTFDEQDEVFEVNLPCLDV